MVDRISIYCVGIAVKGLNRYWNSTSCDSSLVPISSAGAFVHNDDVMPKVCQDRPHNFPDLHIGIEDCLVELGHHLSGRKTSQRTALVRRGTRWKFSGTAFEGFLSGGNHFHDHFGFSVGFHQNVTRRRLDGFGWWSVFGVGKGLWYSIKKSHAEGRGGRSRSHNSSRAHRNRGGCGKGEECRRRRWQTQHKARYQHHTGMGGISLQGHHYFRSVRLRLFLMIVCLFVCFLITSWSTSRDYCSKTEKNFGLSWLKPAIWNSRYRHCTSFWDWVVLWCEPDDWRCDDDERDASYNTTTYEIIKMSWDLVSAAAVVSDCKH